MAQKAFAQNVNECTGCRCCQVACKDKNDLPIGTRAQLVLEAFARRR